MSRSRVQESIPIPVREATRELGQLVAGSRREQGLSQQELATRVGVGRATIARIERGASGVAVGWVLTAAWVLGLPVLRSSDFAAARPTSAVSAFLAQLERQLPKKAGRADTEDVGDF